MVLLSYDVMITVMVVLHVLAFTLCVSMLCYCVVVVVDRFAGCIGHVEVVIVSVVDYGVVVYCFIVVVVFCFVIVDVWYSW